MRESADFDENIFFCLSIWYRLLLIFVFGKQRDPIRNHSSRPFRMNARTILCCAVYRRNGTTLYHSTPSCANICAFRLFTGLIRRAKLLRSSPTRRYSQFSEWALMVECALIANIGKGSWKRHGPLPCSSLLSTKSTAQVNIRTHHSKKSTQRNDSRESNSSIAFFFCVQHLKSGSRTDNCHMNEIEFWIGQSAIEKSIAVRLL